MPLKNRHFQHTYTYRCIIKWKKHWNIANASHWNPKYVPNTLLTFTQNNLISTKFSFHFENELNLMISWVCTSSMVHDAALAETERTGSQEEKSQMKWQPRMNHWIPRPTTGNSPGIQAQFAPSDLESVLYFCFSRCLLKETDYNYRFVVIIFQVNLDFHTKEIISKSITQPTLHSFDVAQSRVYQLMEQDSYMRFLKSDIYLDLTEGRSQRPTNLRRRSRSFTYNEFQDVKSDVAIWL